MKYLTKNNFEKLLLGSAFFATGGGLPYKEHKKIILRALKNSPKIPIKSLDEFNDQALLVSIYGVGNPALVKNIDQESLIKKSLERYERLTGLKIKGLIPGEIGAEGMVFEVASYTDIPVVDSDLVGGRAAPEIQMDVFSVYNQPLTPLLGIAEKSELFLNKKTSALEVEKLIRKFFDKHDGSGVVVGYPILAKVYRKIGAKSTLTQTLEVGELLAKKDLVQVLAKIEGKIVAKTQLSTANLRSEEGFLKGWVNFSNKMKIWVKNENIALYEENKKIVSLPSSIILLDENLSPIHNSESQKEVNKEVTIISLSPSYYWKEKKNSKLWDSAYS